MIRDFFLRGRTGHPLLPELKQYRYAHRGYHDKPQIPENSLPAFRRAIERGWGAELDVHLLKDGTLAVFHDSDLKRCTGEEGTIEDLDLAQLKQLRLEGTQEQVPLFDAVLALFEETKPLIIELKTYKGLFCIESFDPRAVADVRQLRPDIVRGQLVSNFLKDPEGLPRYQRIVLTNLLFDCKARPDFIACKFEDRGVSSIRRTVDKLGVQEVCWTIRRMEDLKTCEAAGAIPIFEKFDPEG